MTMLKSAHSKGKVKYLVFVKIVTFIILSWICPYNNYESSLSKTLENGNKVNILLVMRTHRLLAKHELKNNLYKTNVGQNYEDYGMNKNIKNGAEKKSTYSQVKGDKLNELDAYKKGYKHRHSKKKVIIYTLVKVVKYERLKAGKGKMNRNEYFKYCKEVFNL
ncbi:hypothetical protein PVPAM_010010000 [Plasmodium vivax]|nr:hypothetical protein PVPAM_010010000 [Plasmodium vivax]